MRSAPRGPSRTGPSSADEWVAAAPMELLRVHTWLEDFPAVEREVAAALAAPELTEPVKLVMVPGARALAWFECGRLAEAAEAARAAEAEARRLGFDQHFLAVDYRRALAGLALEQRDLDTAEQLTEQVLSISERRRPAFEFLALLDRAAIWATRGQRPRRAGRHRGGPAGPARDRVGAAGPGRRARGAAPPVARRPEHAGRGWPAGCPPPAAACCWPGSRWPPAITTPRRTTCGRCRRRS